MSMIIGMLGVLIGIGLFLLGFFIGMKVSRPQKNEPEELTPEEMKAIREDRERLMEDQKAFREMLQYNPSTAYGLTGADELKRAGDGS